MSLTFVDKESGNLISKLTNKSPRRFGSLGNGNPFAGIRLTVVGFIISSSRLNCIFSPVNVGTQMTVPQRACKKANEKKQNISRGVDEQ